MALTMVLSLQMANKATTSLCFWCGGLFSHHTIGEAAEGTESAKMIGIAAKEKRTKKEKLAINKGCRYSSVPLFANKKTKTPVGCIARL